jgi:Phage integrase family
LLWAFGSLISSANAQQEFIVTGDRIINSRVQQEYVRLSERIPISQLKRNLSANVIHLQDAKAGARTVPLNSQAVAFLANTGKRDMYVCGLDGDRVMTRFDYHTFWRRLMKGTALTNARPHDCRHTVATLGAMAGGTAFTLRDLLGHKTVAVTSGYVARTVDPIRELSQAHRCRACSGSGGCGANRRPQNGCEAINIRNAAAKAAPRQRDGPIMSAADDLTAAWALLAGYVVEIKGARRLKYFKRGGSHEARARKALARLLRSDGRLDRQLRGQLADLFDPPPSAQRRLVFEFRRRGKHHDAIRNTQIAEHIRAERVAGKTYEAAIGSAVEGFSVSEDLAKKIWGRYGPVFEKIYGPLPGRSRR